MQFLASPNETIGAPHVGNKALPKFFKWEGKKKKTNKRKESSWKLLRNM